MEESEQQSVFSVEPEQKKEPLILSVKSSATTKKKTKGGDGMLVQLFLSGITAAAIFSLRWISPAFQTTLITQYQEKLYAPAESFLTAFLAQLEAWVH